MDSIKRFFKKLVSHQRNWYGEWHAWAGIFAGSILIIVSLTGSLLVFEQELDAWLYPELFGYEDSGELIPLNDVFNQLSKEHPEKPFFSIYQFEQRNNAYILFFEGVDHQYYQAIANPYTGELMGTRIYGESIMGFIRDLHRTLLIPKVGRYIVAAATLFLVVLMITGLRLWIPRRWKHLKKRLTINTSGSWKRQNYDLHNTLGFYFSPFITLISMTGVAITFSSVMVLVIFLVNFQSPQSIADIIGKQSEYQEDASRISIETILENAQQDMPEAEIRGFTIPRDSVQAFTVNFLAPGYAETGDLSFALYDQYSGEKLINTDKDFANQGKLVVNWMTSVHYGTFGGLPTRILALLASLVTPILFVTGFTIWWARRKKIKKSKGKRSRPDLKQQSKNRSQTQYVSEAAEQEKLEA